MNATANLTLEVDRTDWSRTRAHEEPCPEPSEDGGLLLRIDRFALTANNISYAASGDSLGYWGFFPAADNWGRIPVMGYGEVVTSHHPDVAVGERLWGWFPMSRYLAIQAGRVGPYQLQDISAHRQSYSPIYSGYQRAGANPIHRADREDFDCLLRGLYLTSWLCDDLLAENGFFGAERLLITSASSKTAIALAHAVSARGGMPVVGLTSEKNRQFCESLGCYDSVVVYDALEQLPGAVPVTIVDMAGNADLLNRLYRHFAGSVKHCALIGATHHDQRGSVDAGSDPAPVFFFAPSQAEKRTSDWGAAALEQRMVKAFAAFREFAADWMTIREAVGAEQLEAVYQEVLAGRVPPDTGVIGRLAST